MIIPVHLWSPASLVITLLAGNMTSQRNHMYYVIRISVLGLVGLLGCIRINAACKFHVHTTLGSAAVLQNPTYLW